jgi:hypothetical protein
MKKCLAAILVVVLAIGLAVPLAVSAQSGGGACASSVVDSGQGTEWDGDTVQAARSNPANALGALDHSFFSLGFVSDGAGGFRDQGGNITLAFDDFVGTQITVVEQSPPLADNYPEEKAEVWVSADMVTWTYLGNATNQAPELPSPDDRSHPNTFTLQSCIKYVRIIDVTDPAGFDPANGLVGTGNGDAFDLDAVCAGPCEVLEVPVDIKPTSCPNPLNLKSKGVLPVAILGNETFDATQVDPASVRLEGVAPLRWSVEDVAAPFEGEITEGCCMCCTTAGPDGFDDLTLKFKMQEVVGALGAVEDGDCLILTLTGELFDGRSFAGVDVVKILKKGKNGNGD